MGRLDQEQLEAALRGEAAVPPLGARNGRDHEAAPTVRREPRAAPGFRRGLARVQQLGLLAHLGDGGAPAFGDVEDLERVHLALLHRRQRQVHIFRCASGP